MTDTCQITFGADKNKRCSVSFVLLVPQWLQGNINHLFRLALDEACNNPGDNRCDRGWRDDQSQLKQSCKVIKPQTGGGRPGRTFRNPTRAVGEMIWAQVDSSCLSSSSWLTGATATREWSSILTASHPLFLLHVSHHRPMSPFESSMTPTTLLLLPKTGCPQPQCPRNRVHFLLQEISLASSSGFKIWPNLLSLEPKRFG